MLGISLNEIFAYVQGLDVVAISQKAYLVTGNVTFFSVCLAQLVLMFIMKVYPESANKRNILIVFGVCFTFTASAFMLVPKILLRWYI